MSNRYFYQFPGSPHPKVVTLDGYVQVGASGAVQNTTAGTNLDAAGNPLYLPRHFSSVVRNSAGQYTLTLDSSSGSLFSALLSSNFTPVVLTAANFAFPLLLTANVTGNALNGVAAGTVTVQFTDGYGNAKDLPSGGGFHFRLIVKNSSSPTVW